MKKMAVFLCVLIAAILFWCLFAGAYEEEDDEKQFSGLLEDDDP